MVALKFANRVGVWHRKFCWLPTRTVDNRWFWLTNLWRACYQTHDYLYHGGMEKFFVYTRENPTKGENDE